MCLFVYYLHGSGTVYIGGNDGHDQYNLIRRLS